MVAVCVAFVASCGSDEEADPTTAAPAAAPETTQPAATTPATTTAPAPETTAGDGERDRDGDRDGGWGWDDRDDGWDGDRDGRWDLDDFRWNPRPVDGGVEVDIDGDGGFPPFFFEQSWWDACDGEPGCVMGRWAEAHGYDWPGGEGPGAYSQPGP